MSTQTIYSIMIDEISNHESCWLGKLNGCEFECFYQSEDETDAEMIASGFVRVECPPETDGQTVLWAEIWEINQALKAAGKPEITEQEIAV